MSAKPQVEFFVSYASANSALKAKLVDALQLHLNLARDFQFTRWQDSAILPGEDWRQALDRALAHCTSGLSLLSPAFFASSEIRNRELPALINKPAGIIPVLLEPLDFDSMDLGALNGLQIFRHKNKAFSAMSGKIEKDEFVMALYRRIIETYKVRLP